MPANLIYLDNAATTRVDPRVAETMSVWLTKQWGNPASLNHAFGQSSAKAVDKARAQVAQLIGAKTNEIIWTSGATESNNLALKGIARAHRGQRRHIVTIATEHKAVLDTVHWLEGEGFKATVLAPQSNGLVDWAALEEALREDTLLCSVMLVNNETGVIQDIQAIGELCRKKNVVFHVDSAQGTGKVDSNLQQLPVDLMSLTAHKTYGPQGIGALFVRTDIAPQIEAQLHGGGHERGLRSGTLPTHQIVGMGESYELAKALMTSENTRIRIQRDRLLKHLMALDGVELNGDLEHRIPHNINISIDNCDLDLNTLTAVALSSASACLGGQSSHVINAMKGHSDTQSTLMRVSLGRFNTDTEIDFAANYLEDQIRRCRQSKH